LLANGSGCQESADNDSRHPAEPTEHRVLHKQDRPEDVEAGEGDIRVLERKKDPAETRDCRCDSECVELATQDADSQ
jgi:hypothetical protein